MQFKFELYTSQLNVCRNGYFEACRSTHSTQLAFGAWVNSDTVGLLSFLWKAVPASGTDYFNRHIARRSGTVSGVQHDSIMTQAGRVKIGRAYSVTFKYQVIALGIGATYGLKVTVGGNTHTIAVSGALTTVTFAVGSATTEDIEFRCDFRNQVDFHWIEVKETTAATIVSEPIDWREHEISLSRDDIFKGLFLDFVVKATFAGDGYDFLSELVDRVGSTALVLCDIYYRCSPIAAWTDYRQGLIDMVDAEISCDRISVNIEGRDLSSQVIKFQESQYDMRDTVAENGDEVTIPTLYATDHYFSSGNIQRDTLFFKHAFQAILDCVSNNTITVDADFLNHIAFAASTNSAGIFTIIDGNDLRIPIAGRGTYSLSLQETFIALNRIINIGSYLYISGGTTFFKILDYDAMFNNAKIALTKDLYGINNLRWRVFTEKSYSAMRIGFNDYDKDDATEEHGEMQFKFLSFRGNSEVLDLRNDWIGSKHLIETQKNVGGLPAKAEDDSQKYIVVVDSAATAPLDSEGAAWANYNDSIRPTVTQDELMKRRHDFAAYSSRESVTGYERDYESNHFGYLYEWEAPLSISDFILIRDNQEDYLEISRHVSPTASQLIKVWVWEIIFNPSTQSAKFKGVSFTE